MEEILHQLIGGLFHDLQGFFHQLYFQLQFRSTFSPTFNDSALAPLMSWSDHPGHTTIGIPKDKASMKLFCPPWCTKTSTPSRIRSTCGRIFSHTTLGGRDDAPPSTWSKASSWGPKDTKINGAVAWSEPKRLKTADQVDWHNSLHEAPVAWPSIWQRALQPYSGWSPVKMVPKLTNTTCGGRKIGVFWREGCKKKRSYEDFADSLRVDVHIQQSSRI